MGAFQELITRLSLDATGFKEGGKQVVTVTKEVNERITEMAAKSKEAIAGIGEKFKFKEVLAPLAAIATAGGLIELGKHAVEVAKDFDILERRIQGVVRSAERAKQIMEFSEKQSGLFGLFKPEELDNVAVILEALHLKTERFLPVVQKLALVMGSGAEGMKEYAEALGLIAQGESGRALRVLERAGVSVADLQKAGVAFKGPREIASPPNQAVAGIERAVDAKYGQELKGFQDSPEAKAQRLANAMDQAYRKAGNAIRTFFLPYVEEAGQAVTELVESGKIERISNGFLRLFGLKGGDLKDAILKLGNIMEAIPDRIAKVKKAWQDFYQYFALTVKLMTAAWLGMWAGNAIIQVVSAIGRVAAALKGLTILEGVQYAFLLGIEALKKNWIGVAAAIALTAAAFVGLTAIENGLTKYFNGALGGKDVEAKGAGEKAEGKEPDGSYDLNNPNTQYLQQIEQHTRESAKDLRKFALGGGDVGRIGVTPVELGRLKAHGTGRAMQNVVRALEDLLNEHSAQHTGSMLRARAFGG